MANVKSAFLPYESTGMSGNYARVFQVTTSYFLDFDDGTFKASPTTPAIPLTEVADFPCMYKFDESREAWNNGEYQIAGYDSDDSLVCGAMMCILDDTEVSQATLMEYVDFIKKVEDGNWELVGNKWIYYDTNGTTILRQFNVFDASHNPSMTNIYKREKV